MASVCIKSNGDKSHVTCAGDEEEDEEDEDEAAEEDAEA
jgi:hypothetical protein